MHRISVLLLTVACATAPERPRPESSCSWRYVLDGGVSG